MISRIFSKIKGAARSTICSTTRGVTSPMASMICGTSTTTVCFPSRICTCSFGTCCTTSTAVAASSRLSNQHLPRSMYGHAAPRKHQATRVGQHVWPRSKPTEDDVTAIGSSRATSGHDLGQLLLLLLLLMLLLLLLLLFFETS